MPSKIRVLPDHTINQIAAGEVIENASSVVKELVENSLDAGATQITVEISGGGRQLIRISDNGCGMNADDALLCLERHATSKIKAVDDLHTLISMGFRGEAIPSIASISKMTLITAPHEEDAKGTIVMIEGGKLIKSDPVACSPGTQIEVKDLFFNVPARKKFQKSPAHDTQDILKCLTLLALGNPTIRFELISNCKTLLKSDASTLQERISDILGIEYLQETCPIQAQMEEMHLEGYIGMPACTRQNRTGQFLFINKRAVNCPLISYAVRDGYGTALPQNRHPIFVLHLTLPGELVDVNVHPQKREVRLRHEQTIREWIIKAIEGALPAAQEFSSYSPPLYSFEPLYDAAPLSATPLHLAETPCRVEPQKRESPPRFPDEPPLFNHAKFTQEKAKAPKAVCTLPGYIVTESPTQDSLGMIDQRAAHARILFEKLTAAHENGQPLAVQTLLLPYTLELTPHESALLESCLEGLNSCGIGIKAFGRHTFAIDALPQMFGNADIAAFIRDLLSQLQDFCHENQPQESLQKELRIKIAETASRSAISKNRRLSLDEAQSLVNQLMECQLPNQCPKGRPTLVHHSLKDLTQPFGR
ncbi:MAG: DNA mismatch repair endonuclease MutL [Parachlamydia sp.]|nr:DNA mismatch repair endonuclease MutL [Parachlamydia sp.]